MYIITVDSLTLNISPKLPEHVSKQLDHGLSFFVQGAVFAGKASGWDGRCRLYNIRKQTTFTGLLSRVVQILNKNQIQFQFQNNIQFPQFDYKKYSIIPEIKFRDYQKFSIVEALNKKRGIITLPTGAGKTITAGGIIGKMGMDNNLFLVPSIDLLYQTKTVFDKIFQTNCGICGDTNLELDRPITIASVQTIYSKIKQKNTTVLDFLAKTNLLIIDEAHHVAADTIQEICFNCPAPYRFGISATPFRDDGQDLKIEAALGKIIFEITPKELIDQGYLAKPEFYVYEVPANPAFGQNLTYQTAYKRHIVENPYRNQQILDTTKMLADKKLTVLIIVDNIKHGQFLESELDKLGIHTYFIRGAVAAKDRKIILEGLDQKLVECVICTRKIGSEGLDVPSLDCLVNAGAGKGVGLTLQKVGRTLRQALGKSGAYIIDFYDQTKYFKKHAERRIKVFKDQYGEENVVIVPIQIN